MTRESSVQHLLEYGYMLLPLPQNLSFNLAEIQNDLFDFFLTADMSSVSMPQTFEDLRALFYVSRGETKLPKSLNDLHQVYAFFDELSLKITSELSTGMKLPATYFPQVITGAHSFLRPTFYWPQTSGTLTSEPHVDTSLLTMLMGATHDGLEIFIPKNEVWKKIENQPNYIVITFGSLFSEITNGLIPATLHRVVSTNPEARLSSPFFIHGHDQALMEKMNLNGIIPDQTRALTYKQYLSSVGKMALLKYLV